MYTKIYTRGYTIMVKKNTAVEAAEEDWGGDDETDQTSTTSPKVSDEVGHPLESVFKDCLEQVTGGKGNERHGNGKQFMDQPWKHIADTHGDGFLTGQAAKKLQEAQSFEDLDRWNREMYGVLSYTAMAILHRNNNG